MSGSLKTTIQAFTRIKLRDEVEQYMLEREVSLLKCVVACIRL